MDQSIIDKVVSEVFKEKALHDFLPPLIVFKKLVFLYGDWRGLQKYDWKISLTLSSNSYICIMENNGYTAEDEIKKCLIFR